MRILLIAVVLLLTGCAHQVEIRSFEESEKKLTELDLEL